MRVTVFSSFNPALNPYIILFKEALERQGLDVRFERNFNLNWLFSKGRACDAIHLHWIKIAYDAAGKNRGPSIFNTLINNRFVKAVLELVCLVELALVVIISRLAGKIIVFTVHDLYDFGKKSLRGKFQIFMSRKIVFRLSHSIHVHNHHTRRLVASRYNRREGVHVIPHGNYIDYYRNQISRSDARKQLGIPDDAFVFLFLGLIRPYKGIEDLLDAFKNFDHPKARLLIAGRIFGPDENKTVLNNQAKGDSRINLYLDFISDGSIQVYLNACDVFVLPYKDITTSGAAALAFSFSRPTIAPAITSFPEVVTPESGLLYDPDTPDGLLSAMKIACKHPWSEEKIYAYARELDWSVLGAQLIKLYRK